MGMSYIGRFAPSPSGDLHFGSLVTAVASYLQAKAQNGYWLVRIEDIDRRREVKGSAARILATLERYGLQWDNQVLYQSQCIPRYRAILTQLIADGHAYYCDCHRQRIQQQNGIYDNHCRHRQLTPQTSAYPLAIRLRQSYPIYRFFDQLHGWQKVEQKLASEDFTLFRRDGCYAYHLVVVLDDHFQGITEVVRGADLLTPTCRQLSLYQQLNWTAPNYLHLPLVLNNDGRKLSKQNHAQSIADAPVIKTLAAVLHFLNQPLPSDWQDYHKEQLLSWAQAHWQRTSIPKQSKRYSLV
jgi:glutamyl-Q tRNA(Asp) synthetase